MIVLHRVGGNISLDVWLRCEVPKRLVGEPLTELAEIGQRRLEQLLADGRRGVGLVPVLAAGVFIELAEPVVADPPADLPEVWAVLFCRARRDQGE